MVYLGRILIRVWLLSWLSFQLQNEFVVVGCRVFLVYS